MIIFTKGKNGKGFTLIELLVVVSIIALLSSVVLVSLNTARASARDTKRVMLVKQYLNALELYRSDNGDYPNVDQNGNTNTTNEGYCLGEADADTCQDSNNYGNTYLNNKLSKYFSKPPALDEKVTNGSSDLHGLTYYYCNQINGICNLDTTNKFVLKWYKEKANSNCGNASDKVLFCIYYQKK